MVNKQKAENEQKCCQTFKKVKPSKAFWEIVVIGLGGLFLAYQSNQLAQIANDISKQSNDIAKKEFGIEIVSVTTSPPEMHSPSAFFVTDELTIVDKTLNFAIDIRELNGVQKLKLLSDTGNVIQTQDNNALVFEREQLNSGKVSLYFSDTVEKQGDKTVIRSAPLQTSLETMDNVGYYRYFYIFAEYNRSYQLFLVAMKNDKDGNELFSNYRVYSQYDIYELKYSEDPVFQSLDKKMAENYERVNTQFKDLSIN